MRKVRVAGLRVETNRPVPEQRDGGSADGSVQVIFRKEGTARVHGDGWRRLDQKGFATAWFREDGKHVDLEDPAGRDSDYGAELRRVVPFASALQGKIVLHGSAIRYGDSVVAFIGASGVGKSTLADALRDLGLAGVSDDLIPIRLREDAVVVPHQSEDGDGVDLALRAICFLERVASAPEPVVTKLSKQDALARSCLNSFGELRSPKSWRVQFETLGKVTDRVPAAVLKMPDDLPALSRHAESIVHDILPEFLGEERSR